MNIHKANIDCLQIPLPPPSVVVPQGPPRSVLKKPPSVLETSKPLLCPGVPADVPPKIEDYYVADDDEESGSRKRTIRFGDEKEAATETAPDTEESVSASGPSSLQKKMLAMAGQVINN